MAPTSHCLEHLNRTPSPAYTGWNPQDLAGERQFVNMQAWISECLGMVANQFPRGKWCSYPSFSRMIFQWQQVRKNIRRGRVCFLSCVNKAFMFHALYSSSVWTDTKKGTNTCKWTHRLPSLVFEFDFVVLLFLSTLFLAKNIHLCFKFGYKGWININFIFWTVLKLLFLLI